MSNMFNTFLAKLKGSVPDTYLEAVQDIYNTIYESSDDSDIESKMDKMIAELNKYVDPIIKSGLEMERVHANNSISASWVSEDPDSQSKEYTAMVNRANAITRASHYIKLKIAAKYNSRILNMGFLYALAVAAEALDVELFRLAFTWFMNKNLSTDKDILNDKIKFNKLVNQIAKNAERIATNSNQSVDPDEVFEEERIAATKFLTAIKDNVPRLAAFTQEHSQEIADLSKNNFIDVKAPAPASDNEDDAEVTPVKTGKPKTNRVKQPIIKTDDPNAPKNRVSAIDVAKANEAILFEDSFNDVASTYQLAIEIPINYVQASNRPAAAAEIIRRSINYYKIKVVSEFVGNETYLSLFDPAAVAAAVNKAADKNEIGDTENSLFDPEKFEIYEPMLPEEAVEAIASENTALDQEHNGIIGVNCKDPSLLAVFANLAKEMRESKYVIKCESNVVVPDKKDEVDYDNLALAGDTEDTQVFRVYAVCKNEETAAEVLNFAKELPDTMCSNTPLRSFTAKFNVEQTALATSPETKNVVSITFDGDIPTDGNKPTWIGLALWGMESLLSEHESNEIYFIKHSPEVEQAVQYAHNDVNGKSIMSQYMQKHMSGDADINKRIFADEHSDDVLASDDEDKRIPYTDTELSQILNPDHDLLGRALVQAAKNIIDSTPSSNIEKLLEKDGDIAYISNKIIKSALAIRNWYTSLAKHESVDQRSASIMEGVEDISMDFDDDDAPQTAVQPATEKPVETTDATPEPSEAAPAPAPQAVKESPTLALTEDEQKVCAERVAKLIEFLKNRIHQRNTVYVNEDADFNFMQDDADLMKMVVNTLSNFTPSELTELADTWSINKRFGTLQLAERIVADIPEAEKASVSSDDMNQKISSLRSALLAHSDDLYKTIAKMSDTETRRSSVSNLMQDRASLAHFRQRQADLIKRKKEHPFERKNDSVNQFGIANDQFFHARNGAGNVSGAKSAEKAKERRLRLSDLI